MPATGRALHRCRRRWQSPTWPLSREACGARSGLCCWCAPSASSNRTLCPEKRSSWARAEAAFPEAGLGAHVVLLPS